MKAADFTGNGGMSEFLKSVVRDYFRLKNLNPSNYVNPNLNRKKNKNIEAIIFRLMTMNDMTMNHMMMNKMRRNQTKIAAITILAYPI